MIRRSHQIFLKSLSLLLILLAFPVVALAHGDEPSVSTWAGPVSWTFMGFGGLVILAVGLILFVGNRGGSSSAEEFGAQTGLSGYINRMRMFSKNARLYMIHVVGMDVIHGTWEVVFNLYLLAVGFDIAFVGARLMARSIAVAVMSIPAGIISDRVGRKLSFILGDGVGAAMALIAISTNNPVLIMITAVIGGAFGSLHGVAEPAFMAENSEDYERVHLFSVASGTRTAAAIIGSALAGLMPLLLVGDDPARLVQVYRWVAFGGIVIWFGSLIPALLLDQMAKPTDEKITLQTMFANVKHWDLVVKLSAPGAVVGLGAGFALPLMNVFFQEGLGSAEVEIGATFSVGQGLLVVAAFLAPMVAQRLGKIRSIIVTQLISVPFIILLAFAPEAGKALGSVLAIAGLAYIARIATFNMGGPILTAFEMELLDPGERGTQVGIELAISAGLRGISTYFGALFMSSGNFRAPFLLMALFYATSVLMFWFYFGRKPVLASTPVPEATK